MANGKTPTPEFPLSYFDFYKTNGMSHPGVAAGGPSLTRQEFAEECDINSIMKRYEAAGAGINGLPAQRVGEPFYADFANMPTNLLEYMEFMDMAQAQFMQLPAIVRREFDNSAHLFVEYASDPANIGQMREWGLAPPAASQPAPGAPEAAAGAPSAPAPAPAAPAPAAPVKAP